MNDARPGFQPRPQRFALPILVSFSSEAFTVKDYLIDLSEGGIYLQTTKICSVGSQGELRFRVSHFDTPFTVKAEVVRTVAPGEETNGQSSGMGLRFVDLSDRDRDRLHRIVEGSRSGSIVGEIRRALEESGLSLDVALRQRPTDQKMMLALHAGSREIEILIRDGIPSVLIRLLDCPQLAAQHVQMMLRQKSLPTQVLSAIRKQGRWLANEECRWLFCIHPAAMLSDVVDEMSRLPTGRLVQLERNLLVRSQVRSKAMEIGKRRRMGR